MRFISLLKCDELKKMTDMKTEQIKIVNLPKLQFKRFLIL